MSEEELIATSLLVVSVKCGAVLIGAFDGDTLAGFVYSFPGERHRIRMHWSHMLGVRAGLRGAGVGQRLKLLQRDRVLGHGIELVEWTFDPLQPMNAHFNFTKLGVVASEYLENAYGETNSPLHGTAPTDRFVAQWWLRSDTVERLAWAFEHGHPFDPAPAEAPGTSDAPLLNPPRYEDGWWHCDEPAAGVPAGSVQLRIAVPPRFADMLGQAPALALRWRLTTRHLFQQAFAAGFQARAARAFSTTDANAALSCTARSASTRRSRPISALRSPAISLL
jgi:predicted GNAT superfamily acetyltransferase